MKISEFQVDHEAIENGTWRDAIGLPGVRFKLRGFENFDWRRRHANLLGEFVRNSSADAIDPLEQDRIESELLHSACLQDWEGLEASDGAALAFSDAEARKLLTEPRYARFRGSVLATAHRLANETVAEREQAARTNAATVALPLNGIEQDRQ